MKNMYIDDAIFFLRKFATAIDEMIKDEDILFAVLFFALGMEKLLKGILFVLNPTCLQGARL